MMKNIVNYNIVLIGMRGSGKTTIAKFLSKKLNKDFIDTDELVIKKTGSNISKIVKLHGWDYFRKKEFEVVEEIADLNNKIISTGGGVVLKPENISELKKNGIFVYLKASVEVLIKRVGRDLNRPALTDEDIKEEIRKVFSKRKKIYENEADITINTDELSIKDTINQILLRLNEPR